MTEPELSAWLHKVLPADAAYFLWHVARLVRMCDDLADGDIEPAKRPEAVAWVAFQMLLQIPALPFYKEWQGALAPTLATCFATWARTDEAKQSPQESTRLWGYAWRDSIDFVLFQTALLACGPTRAQEIIAEWLVLEHGDGSETFTEWEQSSDGPLRQATEGS